MRHPHLFIPQIYCRDCEYHKEAPEEVREKCPEMLWCSFWLALTQVDGFCHKPLQTKDGKWKNERGAENENRVD